jgi:Uma2 family endonuclease
MAMRIEPLPERTMWTIADVEALPADGNRYEILHGELLVTPLPSARHQRIAARLSLLVMQWCRANTGWTVLAPGGVWVSETNWFEPDLAVYAAPEEADLHWREMPTPLLVVEILSRSTARRDRHRKRPAYLANGVGEVWLIDGRKRRIERWTSASEFPENHDGSISWTPDSALPPLVIPELQLFGPLP